MENSNGKHLAICGNMVFQISGDRSAIYIHNKYSVGNVEGKTIFLKPYEAIYLYLRNRIEPLNGVFKSQISLMGSILQENDMHRLKAYLELKEEGTRINIEKDFFYVVRKSEKQSQRRKVVPVRENEKISFQWLMDISGGNVASVDDDGDVTYYKLNFVNISGKNRIEILHGIDPVRIGNRAIARQEDVPEWMGDRIGSLSFLSEQETHIITGEGNRTEAALIYEDLVKRGMIVKTGFKYGCTFRAYEESLENHSEFLLHVTGQNMEWYEISRAVRVAGAVKKRMVLASILEDEPKYIEIKRIKSVGEFNISD